MSNQQNSQPLDKSLLVNFLGVADVFIFEHRNRIQFTPLQVYGSALVFSPPGSRVRQLFFPTRLAFIRNVKTGLTDRNLHFQIEGRCEPGPIAISRDGQVIASASGSISLFEVATGSSRTLGDVSSTNRSALALGFLKSRNQLAAVSGTGEVQVWDIKTGRKTIRCTVARPCGRGVALCPDHSLVATIDGDGDKLHLWNFENGAHNLTLRHNGPLGLTGNIVFAPDGTTLAAQASGNLRDHELHLWNTETGCHLRQFKICDTNAIAFSPSGKVLASVNSALVCLWDTTTSSLRHKVELIAGYDPCSMAFSPTGERIVIGAAGRLILWDAEKSLNLQKKSGVHPSSGGDTTTITSTTTVCGLFDSSRLPRNQLVDTRYETVQDPAPIQCMTLCSDRKTLATSSAKHPLLLWDLRSGTLLFDLFRAAKQGKQTNPLSDERDIVNMHFSPDGKTLGLVASTHRDDKFVGASNLLEVWDVATGKLKWQKEFGIKFPGYPEMAISADGILALGVTSPDEPPRLLFWEVSTGTRLDDLDVAQYKTRSWIEAIEDCSLPGKVFSADGKFLWAKLDLGAIPT
ncbi:hypothetical protein ACJZ2D_008664 [Fusarium nematophilum]